MDIDYTKILVAVLPIIILCILGVYFYTRRDTKSVTLKTKRLSLEAQKHRDIIKNDYNITKLEIVDAKGESIQKPFKLMDGSNVFKCLATYTDGTKAEFAPYWLQWSKSNINDPWGVQGRQKKAEVTVTASERQERYTELSCWVFPPKKVSPTGNGEIPHDSTGFDYSEKGEDE